MDPEGLSDETFLGYLMGLWLLWFCACEESYYEHTGLDLQKHGYRSV